MRNAKVFSKDDISGAAKVKQNCYSRSEYHLVQKFPGFFYDTVIARENWIAAEGE